MREEKKTRSKRTYLVSRSIICLVVTGSLGSLLWSPPNIFLYGLDILVRTYLVFLGTVMAHEGVHGHLGGTRRTNFLWGRIALIPSLVPFTNFRRTHHLHHAHTNEPDRDPDIFMKPRHAIEIPLRALAMPHQWYFWLNRRNMLDRKHRRDLLFNYAAIAAVFTVALMVVGPARLAWGMVPVLVLVSILLWYPFALKTHEGHSVGPAASRSHDYYGHLMYWLSLGLSMHRVHHEQPQLSWVELRSHVQPAPEGSWGGLIPRRDIKASASCGSPARTMRSRAWSFLILLTVLAGSLVPSPVLAQFRWRAISSPGYAAGGMAAAAAPAFAANSIESGVAVFAVGLTGGAIAGWMIGDAAEDRLARGEALSGWHKNAMRAGTVMAGAGAGALASSFVINAEAERGDGSGSDEATFGSFVAGGMALGVLTQALLDSRLEPGPARADLGIGPGGRPELVLRVEF
jgi:fatty acid desaturase